MHLAIKDLQKIYIQKSSFYNDNECKSGVNILKQKNQLKFRSQIKHAIKKYNSPHGIIISNTTSNIDRNDNILCIPLEIFAFM